MCTANTFHLVFLKLRSINEGSESNIVSATCMNNDIWLRYRIAYLEKKTSG